jgi:hypothetical protein
MQTDFSFQNFELNTLTRTEGWIRKRDDLYNASIYVRPRINPYQGFMQELPTINLQLRPLPIGDTGVIMRNHVTGSILDYVYSDSINHLLKDFRSGRIQVESGLSRPIHLPFLTITPNAGVNGIFYSQTTENTPGMQLLGTYGGKAFSSWGKTFPSYQHTFTPYIEYIGLTAPSMKTGMSPIFTVADGLNQINEMKFGLSNALFSLADLSSDPRFGLDIYALSFLGAPTFTSPVPKGCMHAEIHLPRLSIDSQCGWNFQENLVDFANLVTKWTVNRYYALSVEMRHRGPFYWKKDEIDNYILDVTRPLSQLRNSTLSDNRNTFLAKMQLELTPQCWCQVENHIGWGRAGQPLYNETKLDLFTIIATMWELKLSFTHTVNANEYAFGFSMIPSTK